MKNQIKKLICIIALGCALSAATAAEQRVFNILDYGAVESKNGATLSTSAIQAAIDECHRAGGGMVLVPRGFFATGTIVLKSNVHLHLDAWAKLYGAPTLDSYKEYGTATEEPRFQLSLIHADNVDNIKITGSSNSELDGCGYNFRHSHQRPKLLKMEGCTNIEIRDITIKNSGSWCTIFTSCDQILIDRVTVKNYTNQNNDGINLDGSSNVTLTNCSIQSGDDSICLKSSVEKSCENITIKNCQVSSSTAAFKLGTASGFAFKNIHISDCTFFDCPRGTIKILMVDGGEIDGLTIDNIELLRCSSPILMRLGNRGRSYDVAIRQIQGKDAKHEGRPMGSLKNVYISNIHGTATAMDFMENGMMFTGIPGYYIENVQLKNIDIRFEGYGNEGDMNIVVPEDEHRYPEQRHFEGLPSYGLYLRHIKGLELENVKFSLMGSESRPALYLEDVKESSFTNLTVDKDESASVDMIKKGDVEGVTFKKYRVNSVRF